MSSLRVINVSPDESRVISKDMPPEHDGLLGSPSIPGISDSHLDSSSGIFEPMSTLASPAPPSVFDIAEEPPDERFTDPTTIVDPHDLADEQDDESYNLKPPPPTIAAQRGLEALADRFFSAEHLDEILQNYPLASKLTQFIAKYCPAHSDTLRQYMEAKKAMAAVEYANAIASRIQHLPGHASFLAASFDVRFEAWMKQIIADLVQDVLPRYLTHCLVLLVTDTLVKDITGNLSPVMHELIPSLAEVYCVSDPSVRDNPIVYASEEFYHASQYSKDYVIGRNCRFLQGSKTSSTSIRRLIEALAKGEEVCETLLNYRRDGSPFMNLLMIAPLYDNKGMVRYYLGCQIDVTSLIEDGRGLESFAQLLSHDRRADGSRRRDRDPKQALGDLSQMFSEEEAEIARNRTRPLAGAALDLSSLHSSMNQAHANRGQSARSSRIVLGMDDNMREASLWPSASLGSSGRLPGVYQNYLLVRPYPSLRITFTSPTLRIPGLLQTKLLDRIGGPSNVRDGLLHALSRGTGVTAKVMWLTSAYDGGSGRPRWLHCTPLFGSDDCVGVWMIVMVENEQVTGSLNAYGNESRTSLLSPGRAAGASQFSTNKLYADYLKREGRPLTSGTQQTSSSTRERREAEEHFRDF